MVATRRIAAVPGTGDYLIIGAVAAVVTFAVTPLVGGFAKSRGWVYHPSERTVHTRPIPAIGGLAMFAGFIVAFAVARLLDRFDSLFARNSEPAASSPPPRSSSSPASTTTSRASSRRPR